MIQDIILLTAFLLSTIFLTFFLYQELLNRIEQKNYLSEEIQILENFISELQTLNIKKVYITNPQTNLVNLRISFEDFECKDSEIYVADFSFYPFYPLYFGVFNASYYPSGYLKFAEFVVNIESLLNKSIFIICGIPSSKKLNIYSTYVPNYSYVSFSIPYSNSDKLNFSYNLINSYSFYFPLLIYNESFQIKKAIIRYG